MPVHERQILSPRGSYKPTGSIVLPDRRSSALKLRVLYIPGRGGGRVERQTRKSIFDKARISRYKSADIGGGRGVNENLYFSAELAVVTTIPGNIIRDK